MASLRATYVPCSVRVAVSMRSRVGACRDTYAQGGIEPPFSDWPLQFLPHFLPIFSIAAPHLLPNSRCTTPLTPRHLCALHGLSQAPVCPYAPMSLSNGRPLPSDPLSLGGLGQYFPVPLEVPVMTVHTVLGEQHQAGMEKRRAFRRSNPGIESCY